MPHLVVFPLSPEFFLQRGGENQNPPDIFGGFYSPRHFPGFSLPATPPNTPPAGIFGRGLGKRWRLPSRRQEGLFSEDAQTPPLLLNYANGVPKDGQQKYFKFSILDNIARGQEAKNARQEWQFLPSGKDSSCRLYPYVDIHFYSYYYSYKNMQTIQVTVHEELLRNVDRVIHKLGTTRSAFVREALQAALQRLWTLRMESRHRAGYAKKPVGKDEFVGWEEEQVWGDE